MRGNVLDMAVGVIVGGAFGKIVSSFVDDVLMPPIGMLLGKVNFSDLKAVLSLLLLGLMERSSSLRLPLCMVSLSRRW